MFPTLTKCLQAGSRRGRQGHRRRKRHVLGRPLGHFVDPFGHAWTVATHVADLTEQEMEKGAQAFYASMAEKKSA